jgi:hypothetical protein
VLKSPLIELLKNSWQLFSKGYRKVLKYIWWFFRHVRAVFPSLETISKDTKLSKRQVQNALKYFLNLGIIAWIKRPYRSNVYFMPDEIIKLDLANDKEMNAVSLENCHQNCHVLDVVLSSENINKCTSEAPSAPVPKSSEKEQEQAKEQRKAWYYSLPRSLRLKFMWDSFDFKRFGWVIKALSEQQVYDILNDLNWYKKQNDIKQPERFITQRALAKIRGH